MKMTRKLVISSLAILTGAAVAGSITSTVAWFQYAVRAQVAYTGTTSHCSKMLRISADDGTTWGTDINLNSLGTTTNKFAPITTGAQAKNADLSGTFYSQPNYRQGAYANWFTASSDMYAQFEILVKVNDGNTQQTQIANDVYLTDVTIQDASSGLDLSNAIRVHIATSDSKYFLFAKSATPTAVGGYLDINNDGEYDTSGYEWEAGTKVVYGEADAYQTAYATNDSTIIATEDQYGVITNGTPIGTTKASGNLSVTVTIWLEGWAILATGIDHNNTSQTINKSNTQIWDSTTYVNKKFNVGLTFGVALHSDADDQ